MYSKHRLTTDYFIKTTEGFDNFLSLFLVGKVILILFALYSHIFNLLYCIFCTKKKNKMINESKWHQR